MFFPFSSFKFLNNGSSFSKLKASMNVYLCTSTSGHHDEQQHVASLVVGDAICESENQTKAEGRQTDVNFPSTTSRTDRSFFYPNKKISSLFHRASDGNDSSKSTPVSCSDNGRVTSEKGSASVQSTDATDTIGTGEKMNGHYFLIQPAGSNRRKVHKEEKKKNESSPSKASSSSRHAAEKARTRARVPSIFHSTNSIQTIQLYFPPKCLSFQARDIVGKDELTKLSTEKTAMSTSTTTTKTVLQVVYHHESFSGLEYSKKRDQAPDIFRERYVSIFSSSSNIILNKHIFIQYLISFIFFHGYMHLLC